MTNSPLQTYVPSPVAERLIQLAKQRGTTASRLIRDVLEEWLATQITPTSPESPVSAWVNDLGEGEYA